jgi:membrane-associated phospholipid phosphatase
MALAKIDWTLFFGHNPNLLLESWIRPMLSEWMAFAYSSYGPLFAVVFGSLYLKKENNPAEEMIFMSTLALAIGYASYTFFPARGPMYAQKFTIPLDLYYMKEFKDLFMDQPRIDRDCFPSLHTAVTMISLFSAWKYIRPLFWLILPIAIFVPIACVYLRYHYVVDVLAGFVLAIMVIGLTKFVQKKKESRL